MADMLVDLMDLELPVELEKKLLEEGIQIKQALAPDRSKVMRFAVTFSEEWSDEVAASFSNMPVTCYIAVKDKEIIGFACYEATAKAFFGPTGVNLDYRKKGIGKALLLRALIGLRELGYAYGFIGSPAESAIHFYTEAVHGTLIENKKGGIYRRMVKAD